MGTYNFSNIDHCRAFIGLLLDDYCPKQLEGIDDYVLEDAVRYCKESDFELTGNMLYNSCCYIATNNLILKLNDIKEYDLENYINDAEMTDFEANCLRELLNNTERFALGNGIIECYCNGSDDCSIYIVEDSLTDNEILAMQRLDDITECFTDFDNAIGGVNSLMEMLETPTSLEVKIVDNEPDICD